MPGRYQADAIFAALLKDKEAIEAELGALDWQDLPERKACRIARYRDERRRTAGVGASASWLVDQ